MITSGLTLVNSIIHKLERPYEFDEIPGEWNSIDLKNDLGEVVVDGKEKLDYGLFK